MRCTLFFLTHTLALVLLCGLLAAGDARAQAPTMAYQGYLTDDGAPLDGTANLRFALYTSASGSGTPVWEERQTGVVLDEGVFSVLLGSVEALDDVDFDGPLYLGVTVNGGNELAPRVPLSTAPTSLFAHDIADGVAVRSLNGLTEDVTIRAGDNVTITEDAGALTIGAEAAEPFALPFSGVHEENGVAFFIESSTGPPIVGYATGESPGLIASSVGGGDGGVFTHTSSGSDAGALYALSQGGRYAGRFVHAAPEGHAGIFESTSSDNPFPALMAQRQGLNINPAGFSGEALAVRGDEPVIGIYAPFEGASRPGVVLAGVNGNGNLVDKWGILRQFFGDNALLFTYGTDPDPAENNTVLSLTQFGPTASTFIATNDLGETGTPLAGRRYRDNTVYAWAEVNSDGSVSDSFGCTVTKGATGTYTVTLKRALPNGVSAIVTPKTLNDPVIATAAANAGAVQVATKTFNGTAFVFFDSAFYIQVVGRP